MGLFTFEGDEVAFPLPGCQPSGQTGGGFCKSRKTGRAFPGQRTKRRGFLQNDSGIFWQRDVFRRFPGGQADSTGSGAVRSVPMLCKNHRHVFYGNNLYCKGACYGAREKVEGRQVKDLVYRGEDIVTGMLGMEHAGVRRSYLLSAGGAGNPLV